MNARIVLLSLALSPLALATTAATAGPPANRIVGIYLTEAEVRPCGSNLPFEQVRNTLMFNAGGTWVDSPRFPAGGADIGDPPVNYQRSQGLGTWSYDHKTGKYLARVRFDQFVDGVYTGYTRIRREILMSHDGKRLAGPVRATGYSADGQMVLELCGWAVSKRDL